MKSNNKGGAGAHQTSKSTPVDEIDPKALKMYAKEDLKEALLDEAYPYPALAELENWLDRPATLTEWEVYATHYEGLRHEHQTTAASNAVASTQKRSTH